MRPPTDLPERGPAPTTPVLCDRCAQPIGNTTSNTIATTGPPQASNRWIPPPLMGIPWWDIWPLSGQPAIDRPPPPAVNAVHRGWQVRQPRRRPRRPPPHNTPRDSQVPLTKPFHAPEDMNSQNQSWGQSRWEHPNPFTPLQQMKGPTTEEKLPYHWPKGQVRPPRRQPPPPQTQFSPDPIEL